MKRKIIKTTKDYQEVLVCIDEMFDKKNTAQHESRETITESITVYKKI